MIPDASIRGRRQPGLCNVLRVVPESDQMSGKRGRKLRVDDKSHGLGRTDDRVIDMLGGVFERRRDVIVLQVWIVPEDFCAAHSRRQQVQDILHTHAQTSDARTAAEYFGVGCDAVQMTGHARAA